MTPQMNRDHEVVVIGAGQSGLAAGYHLARRGIDFVSPAKLDALPGLPFPLPGNAFPTGHEMADYLESYAAHHHLPVLTGAPVDRLRKDDPDDAFTVSVAGTDLRAGQVIVATGPFQRPFIPDVAAQLDPSIVQIHSAEYRNPTQLAEGPVLVVGVSHSGADIAYELAMSGHPIELSGVDHGQLPFSVESRRMRMLWPALRVLAGSVLTMGTPIGRRMAPKVRGHGGPLLRVRRPDLERAGVRRHLARVTSARDGRPVLADGTALDVTNVVWCTGYRPDFSWIDIPAVPKDGWPVHSRGVVASVPGLYMLGLPFLYAFASMLVLGANRDARYVVDRAAMVGSPGSATGRAVSAPAH
jgi:putative flavoprotein involved in K+ transport